MKLGKLLVVLPKPVVETGSCFFVKIVLVFEKSFLVFLLTVFVTVCVRIVVHVSLFIFFLLFCCCCVGKVLYGFSAEFVSVSKVVFCIYQILVFFCLLSF